MPHFYLDIGFCRFLAAEMVFFLDKGQIFVLNRDVLSKNSHKFQIIVTNRNICSLTVKSFMMAAIALP